MRGEKTYTWELDTAVTAFGSCAFLLDVQKSQAATRGLNNADFVGAGVVSVFIVSILATIVHSWLELMPGPDLFLVRDRVICEMEVYEGNVRVAASVLQALGGHCDDICRCVVRKRGTFLAMSRLVVESWALPKTAGACAWNSWQLWCTVRSRLSEQST
jgi:hypothetical protein